MKQLEEKLSRIQELEGLLEAVQKELHAAEAAKQAALTDLQMLLQSSDDLNAKLSAAEDECKSVKDACKVELLTQELHAHALVEDMKQTHTFTLVEAERQLKVRVDELQQELESAKDVVAELQEKQPAYPDINSYGTAVDQSNKDCCSVLEAQLAIASARIKELEEHNVSACMLSSPASKRGATLLPPYSVLPTSDKGMKSFQCSRQTDNTADDVQAEPRAMNKKESRSRVTGSIIYRVTVEMATVLAVALGVTVYCKHFEREVLEAWMSSSCEKV
jgi:hypothetical protein